MKNLIILKKVPLVIFLNTFCFIFSQSVAQQNIGYQWAKGLIQPNTNSSGNQIVVDGNGNAYVLGGFQNTLNFGTGSLGSGSNGSNNTFFVKYDTNGNVLWAKSINSAFNSNNRSDGIALDANGYIYIAGNFNGTVDFDPGLGSANLTSSSASDDIFFAKYDNNGNYIWAKSVGSTNPDACRSLIVDPSGNIYITGYFSLTADFDPSAGTANLSAPSSANIFIAKYDSNGNYLFANKIETSAVSDYSIALDGSENIYIVSVFQGTVDFDPSLGTANLTSVSGSYDIFFSKYDNNGNYLWAKSIGGSQSQEYGRKLVLDSNGNILITGSFSGTVDFDPGVGTANLTYTSNSTGFLAKYDNNGNYLWAKSVGGLSLAVNGSGDVNLIGWFQGTKDFDPTTGTALLTSISNSDIFFSKYDSNGNYLWAKNVGGGSGRSIAVSLNGYIYTTGGSAGTVDFDLSLNTAYLNPSGVFTAKYFDCGTYANPISATTISTLVSCYGDSDGTVTLTAIGGTSPYTYSWNSTPIQTTVTANNLSAGNYTLTIKDSKNCFTEETVNINEPTALSVSTTNTNVSCYGGNNGSATATVTGGISPYSYFWNTSPTQSTATATNLTAGNYTVTVTDSNGCVKSKIVTIIQPNVLQVINSTSTSTNCSGSCTGSLQGYPAGGTGPWTFLWDVNAGNQTGSIAYNLCEGSYTLTITDDNGCVASNSNMVTVKSAFFDSQIFLTNLAAIDQINVSPSFSAYYTYNLPTSITPPVSNPRNFVDPGKKARFKVECTNNKSNGQSIVSGICKVRTNSPYITITDSSSALNNIGWSNYAWSADEFEINIDPNTPPGTNAYIDFVVQESGQDYSTTCIAIPISPLVYSPTTTLTIDDDNNPDSQGNDNDICESNEIIEFYPWMDNISTLNAEYVRGRFENLDNLSYINIWNGVQGVGTTVYDATWWNYSFAQPQIINASDINTTPEYDFVFNYNNANTINDFKLYMVMAGGFKLFSGNALSLVQWTLPYTFAATGSTSSGSQLENTDGLTVFPNPTNDFITIKNDNLNETYVIFNSIGQQILTGKLGGRITTIDIRHLQTGLYLLQVGKREKQSFKLMKE